MSVREKGGHKQKDRHSGAEENRRPVVIVLILEGQVQDNSRYINKPQKIGNDKYFIKRNMIINRHMDDLVFPDMSLLQPGKPNHVDEEI